MGYFDISKRILIPALGVQPNFKEYNFNKIDVKLSGCLMCAHYVASGEKPNCAECKTKVYMNKSKTINEKHRYGDKHRLKLNSLKILLYLHSHHYLDERGFVRYVNMRQMAEIIGCSVRSIDNNLKLLERYGYLEYSSAECGCRSFKIVDYETTHGYAEQGGAGYVTLSHALLSELFKLTDITSLRLALRCYVDVDMQAAQTGTNKPYVCNIRSLKRKFPKYIRRNKIVGAFEKIKGILSYYIEENIISYSMLSLERYAKGAEKEDAAKVLTSFTNKFNSYLYDVVDVEGDISKIDAPEAIMGMALGSIDKTSEYIYTLELADEDIEDLAVLAVTYTMEATKRALMYVYKTYIKMQLEVKSYGALVRTILKNECYNLINNFDTMMA